VAARGRRADRSPIYKDKYILQIDPVSLMITGLFQLQHLFQQLNPHVKFYLRHIQKLNNVMYKQDLISIGGIKEKEKYYSDYYITLEVFMISTPKDIYMVNIHVPSPDPLPRPEHSYFSWVNEWLGDFRVLIQ
jgi:hypothetical protein